MTTGHVSMADIEATFHWKIPDFFSKIGKSSCYNPIRSPNFSFRDCTWLLEMFCKSGDDSTNLYLALHPIYVGKTVDFTLYLKMNDGKKFNERQSIHQDFKCFGPCRAYKQFITLSELRNVEKDLVHSGTLTLMCHTKEVNSPAVNGTTMPEEHLSETTTSKELLRLDTLSSDFRDFFTSKEACDVVLRVKDKEFQTHRAILMARSSVFAAMFKNDTSEKESGVVTIPDCDPDSFENFLKYLYTGMMEQISCENACHLYVTADKYDVEELKAFCVTSMTRSLAVKNVCDVVILSDLYEEAELLSSCHNFFKRNFQEIISSADWINLLKTNYRLANRMLEKMASTVEITDKKNESLLFVPSHCPDKEHNTTET